MSDSRDQSTPRFYTLTPGWGPKYYFATVDTDLMGEASVRWSHRELARFDGCAILTVVSGTTPGDFIRNGALLMVVSDRVVAILRENGVKSFTTYKVEVMRGGKKIASYNGLAVLGRGGPNNPTAYRDGPMPGTSIQRIRGLSPTKWEGSDLFVLDDLYRVVLATERLKDIFKKEKVTNCLFEPAEEFEVGYPGHYLKTRK
mgnify:CR=1 FL=1